MKKSIITTVWLFLWLICAGRAQTNDLSYIYVMMMENDQPRLDYEGEGMIRDWKADERGLRSNTFDCELVVMKIPDGQSFYAGGKNDSPTNYLVQFSGVIQRTGKNGIHVKGMIDSKINGRVQFVKMEEAGEKKTDDFPESAFAPGKTSVDFSGTVVAWVKKE